VASHIRNVTLANTARNSNFKCLRLICSYLSACLSD